MVATKIWRSHDMYFPYSVKVVRNGSIVLGRLSLSRFQGVRGKFAAVLKNREIRETPSTNYLWTQLS